jgi:hypothetical protein
VTSKTQAQDWLDADSDAAAPPPSRVSPLMRSNLALSDPNSPPEADLMRRAEKLYVNRFGSGYQNMLKGGQNA